MIGATAGMLGAWMIGSAIALADAAPDDESAADETAADDAAAPGELGLEPVQFAGARDERRATAFEATLREQLATGATLAPACSAPPCPTPARSIRVEVEERERDYAMTVAIVDGTTSAARRTVSCEVCTPTEAATAAATAVLELLREPSDVARVRIRSTPSAAEVRLDGDPIGTTPAELTTTAGPHTIEVRKPGFRARAREVELTTGSQTLRFELMRERSSNDRALQIAGWTMIGVGVAALVGGITLVAIDEKPIESDCSGPHVDRFGNCEFRWNTLAGGATLLAGGLASAGAGTALVVIGTQRRRTELRGGPTHASITVRF